MQSEIHFLINKTVERINQNYLDYRNKYKKGLDNEFSSTEFGDFDLSHKHIEALYNLTKDTLHNGKTFFEHLVGTYYILKHIMVKSEPVCLAGLYHAIYEGGTGYFKHSLQTYNRQQLKEKIGSRAEHLVYEFCSIQNRRPSLVNRTGLHWTDEDYNDLLSIEIANLFEQAPDKTHVGKFEFLEQLQTQKNKLFNTMSYLEC